MRPAPQVVVVGSYVQDLSFRTAGFPRPGETVVGTFSTGPGGKGSNQAVAAARAGAATLYVGAVGRDAFADVARRFYQEEGIEARWIEKPGHSSGAASIVVDTHGQNQIVVALGANAELQPSDLDLGWFDGARVLVQQFESNLATAAWLQVEARRRGLQTILNPAPMRADFDPTCLGAVDVFVPNESEFTALANRLGLGGHRDFTEATLAALPPAELHALCRQLGVPAVIVTLGARGCLVSEATGAEFIPALRGIPVVDTTGAGDAFVGGLAAGWVETGDLVAAARFATVVAGLSVTKPGTAPAMPRRAEIDAFLRGR